MNGARTNAYQVCACVELLTVHHVCGGVGGGMSVGVCMCGHGCT